MLKSLLNQQTDSLMNSLRFVIKQHNCNLDDEEL